MKKMMKNESGLTLVELLAVLVLISLVTGIIWTTMSISIKHNSLETTKLQLQQEANAIITKLQAVHRQEDCYRLYVDDGSVEVEGCSTDFHEVLGNDFSYEAEVDGDDITGDSIRIRPNKRDLVLTEFIVKPKTEAGQRVPEGRKVNVPTTISRIKNQNVKEGEK